MRNSQMQLISRALKSVVILLASTTLWTAAAIQVNAASASSSDWLQQGGPNRDGNVPASVAGKLASSFPDQKIPVLWRANVGYGIAPVVAQGGRLYTYGLFVSQINSTGAAVIARGPGCPNFIGSEPVVVDGLLYVRENDCGNNWPINPDPTSGNLICYDLRFKASKSSGH